MMRWAAWCMKGEWERLLYFNFNTAFHTVSHHTFPDKLMKYRPSKLQNRWTENWQNWQAQRAVISVTKSRWRPFVHSVLQALILKPTLLKIIINDRTEYTLSEFAGDRKLQETVNVPDVWCHPEGLYKLEKRVNRNLMKCSKGKFKVLPLSRNNCRHSTCWGLASWKAALWRRILGS